MVLKKIAVWYVCIQRSTVERYSPRSAYIGSEELDEDANYIRIGPRLSQGNSRVVDRR